MRIYGYVVVYEGGFFADVNVTATGISDLKYYIKLLKFSAVKALIFFKDAEIWLGYLVLTIFMNKWIFEQTYVWVRFSLE